MKSIYLIVLILFPIFSCKIRKESKYYWETQDGNFYQFRDSIKISKMKILELINPSLEISIDGIVSGFQSANEGKCSITKTVVRGDYLVYSAHGIAKNK